MGEDPDDLGQTFDLMRACHPDADEGYVLGADPLANIRYAVAGHLSYAGRFLREAAVLDSNEDAGAE